MYRIDISTGRRHQRPQTNPSRHKHDPSRHKPDPSGPRYAGGSDPHSATRAEPIKRGEATGTAATRPEGHPRGYGAGAMSLRPEALRGAGEGTVSSGQVDYRLARNAVVREYRRGRLSRLDVCDAHPELLRAARQVGDEARDDCPICGEAKLRLVSYVFGSRLSPSGVCVTTRAEMTRLARTAKDMVCYVVEVCPACCWNHLARSFAVTTRR